MSLALDIAGLDFQTMALDSSSACSCSEHKHWTNAGQNSPLNIFQLPLLAFPQPRKLFPTIYISSSGKILIFLAWIMCPYLTQSTVTMGRDYSIWPTWIRTYHCGREQSTMIYILIRIIQCAGSWRNQKNYYSK